MEIGFVHHLVQRNTLHTQRTSYVDKFTDKYPKVAAIIDAIMNVFVVLSAIPLFGLAFSFFPFVYGLVTKQSRLVTWSFGFFIFNSLIVTLFYLALSSNDPFTDDLTIPEDIEIEKPLTLNHAEGIAIDWATINLPKPDSMSWDIAYWGGEPGIYDYVLWYQPQTCGELYVKAFEINKGTPLSAKAIRQRTTTPVCKTNELTLFHKRFTLYEGDWGSPYAARFELWFSPDSAEPDYRIASKNYVVEGWMR